MSQFGHASSTGRVPRHRRGTAGPHPRVGRQARRPRRSEAGANEDSEKADQLLPLDSKFASVGDAGAASVVRDTTLALENTGVGDRTARNASRPYDVDGQDRRQGLGTLDISYTQHHVYWGDGP